MHTRLLQHQTIKLHRQDISSLCLSLSLSLSLTLSYTYTSMKMNVKESVLVKPLEETPSGSLWLSSLDLLMPPTYHTRTVYFFRHDGSTNFFDAAVLKAALSRALVDFYPFAGRLRKDENGRIEINCNGEGVLFIEAECDGALDDLGDFSPRPDVSFVAKVDYSHGISSFPLSLLQLTRFKCGGVSLGVTNEHHVVDGVAALHYINTWSEIARGLTTAAATPPFTDRRLLAARNPPRPQFPHVEHHPPPSLKTPVDTSGTTTKTFRLTLNHLKTLKEKISNDKSSKTRYSTYETVAGHVWRCICMARQLPHDQESKLQIAVDGRPRLQPPLPARYFGNGIFYVTPIGLCGELESQPLRFAVEKIHEALARMDDEYLRSSLDYLEVRLPEIHTIAHSEETVKCPNSEIVSWLRLPFYKADFGWGEPVFAGPGAAPFEGKCYLCVDPKIEGDVLMTISLPKPHMELFQNFIFDI